MDLPAADELFEENIMTEQFATVIPYPAPVLLPIEGETASFPVRRVYCVGRNYADHAIEMGHDPSREPPFFFQKNPDNLLPNGDFPIRRCRRMCTMRSSW